MSDPDKLERTTSTVASVLLFLVFAVLASLTLVVFKGAPLWLGLIFGLTALFFGWLVAFAPASTRAAVMRCFPWA
jgi:uncharacterized membrane protein YagU involved in acid resistance